MSVVANDLSPSTSKLFGSPVLCPGLERGRRAPVRELVHVNGRIKEEKKKRNYKKQNKNVRVLLQYNRLKLCRHWGRGGVLRRDPGCVVHACIDT